jgi:hypothetical protein
MTHKLEILKANYQEHMKFEKELSFIYPLNHPKRLALLEASNKLITEINSLKA